MEKKIKPKKKGKKVLSAEERALLRRQRKHASDFSRFFKELEFKLIRSDGTQINFEGRTGELDGIYIYKNIVLLIELTVAAKHDNKHLLGKKPLFDKIHENQTTFIEFAKEKYKGFSSALDDTYSSEDFQIRIIYAPLSEPNQELIDNCPNVHFMHGVTKKYFISLAKTIHRSARIEFLNFLEVPWDSVGENVIKTQSSNHEFQGYLLPEGNSAHPKGFKIVSFYADPETLINKAYVLRRDGWRDDNHLYQRVLVSKKITHMRRYLTDEQRVFVNNVIVTLPSDTALNNIGSPGQNIPPTDLLKARAVSIIIPGGYNTIGIVDGQHRVFCYHEGADTSESKIGKLRKRQNLLVTGIIYPKNFTPPERHAFEAKLFLEINDNQTRTRSALRQDIEVIVRPFSGIAVAKRVMRGLTKKGPYAGLFQSSYFDSASKIKTSSIVSYGLRPLVKFDGTDSLFHAWQHPQKDRLKAQEKNRQKEKNKEYSCDLGILEEYIDFCTSKINEFFVAAKLNCAVGEWDVEADTRSPLLNPTAVNGLIACLRKVIGAEMPLAPNSHKHQFKDISSFKFSAYKSSNWQSLGKELFEKYYL